MDEADKAKTIGVSLPKSDWHFIEERGVELGLAAKAARSTYLRMLVDLDRKFRFAKHPHSRDNTWRLYEDDSMGLAAEQAGNKYLTGPGKGGATPPGKPPDNPKRDRGDGPRRAVS